jgi:ferrochelatase
MQGLLLMNLGTPDEPETGAVRRYLREYLSDPRVLDINPVGRAALLNAIILPTRPSKSAEAYKKVWTERGSPLLFHSVDLTDRVKELLGDGWCVKLAMRYGKPDIASTLDSMIASGVDHIVVFPLFPHFASSSTGSALEAVYVQAAKRWNVPQLAAVPAFYDDPGFIGAFAEVGQAVLDEKKPDFVLFSFHGLPERHMRKSDDTGKHCLESNTCCDSIIEANRNCYRAQCYATAREIAAALHLDNDGWSVSFQSRLGRTPWIRPYTDVVLPELAAQGVKRLAVFCPAFVADCLETLEEIGLRAAEQFTEAGGDELTLVPSLNSTAAWAEAVATIAKRHALVEGAA